MTGETIRDLVKPLIGKSGSISLLVAGPATSGSSQQRTRS